MANITLVGYNSGKIVKPDGSESDNVNIDDNVKLQIGTNNDLKLYHNGSHSLISHDGAGELKIATETNKNVAIGTTGSTVTIGNDLTVTGDLIVQGDTTTVNTANLLVEDNLILLNSGASSNANDSGIIIERGSTGDNAIIAWDESADKFTLGTTTAAGNSTGDLTITAGDLVLSGLVASGTVEFGSISDGTITVTAFVDEDDMSSDSAALIPTQQSVKAYVDAQVTAQDLDFQGDSGGALSIDLDSETLTFTGGTGIDTSGSGNALTIAIDSTVATLAGSQTLTNKTINGATLSGTLAGTPTFSGVGTHSAKDVFDAGLSVKNGSTSAGFIEFFEDSDNGTNKVTLIGPASTGDVTLTLPAATDTLVGLATSDTLTNKTLTSAVLNGTISGTSIKDEDDMTSNSASHLATQQSIKAYVDSQTGGGAGSALTTTLPAGAINISSGDIVSIFRASGQSSARVMQSSSSTGNVIGIAAEDGPNTLGDNVSIRTSPGGATVTVNKTSDTSGHDINAGDVVYASMETGSEGKCTSTAPSTSGTVYRLGYATVDAASNASTVTIVWQPQFIADLG